MNLKKVSSEYKSDMEFIEKLYIESFPRNERRPVLEMNHLIEQNPRYNVLLISDESDVRVGFITYWDFDTFLFLEHFAISPEFRNGGFGRKSIGAFIENTTLPLITEIELPSISEFAQRRMAFYEKLGFKVWDIPYEQPPYEDDCSPIPMLLLTYRNCNLAIELEDVLKQLHRYVYKKK